MNESVIREGSNITLEDREGFYLSPRVAVMVLVLVPHGKFLWVCFLNHLIRHFFTHSLKHKVIKTKTQDTPSLRVCPSLL